jgi:hypothetical protein
MMAVIRPTCFHRGGPRFLIGGIERAFNSLGYRFAKTRKPRAKHAGLKYFLADLPIIDLFSDGKMR